jgi:hypothetical protein
MVPTHHKDEMHVAINKANQEKKNLLLFANTMSAC